MSWLNVQELRKSGHFQEAIALGIQELATTPGDVKLRTQVDWAFYGAIKTHVSSVTDSLKASQRAPTSTIARINEDLCGFTKLSKRRPDNALTNILRELSKIASSFPRFPSFVRWVDINGLGTEDWQYRHFEGKSYPPIALGVARALTKWVKAFPEAKPEDVDLALEWINRIRAVAKGDDAVWLDWDRVLLLRKMNRHVQAAQMLGSVIKTKRNEFWVWAEAARLYADDQLDLALACACRALECGSDPKFTVNVHRELAQMLADRGDYSQASRELVTAIGIRQEQGWKIDKELQALISSSWYNPAASDAENPKSFYARYSQEALVLCFDSVKVQPATYLGAIIPYQQQAAARSNKAKPLPRFAVRMNGCASVGIVGPGIRTSALKIGEPVTLIVGQQLDNKRETIVQVATRPDGSMWDYTDRGSGLVSREASEGKNPRIFINRDMEVSMADNAWVGSQPPVLGQGVRFQSTLNQKTGRRDIFAVAPGPHPEVDVKAASGRLKRNGKGFAFIDDAFVAPHLVGSIPMDVDDVTAILIYSKHPKEMRYGWRAVKISARRS
jgi:hypothetical protein